MKPNLTRWSMVAVVWLSVAPGGASAQATSPIPAAGGYANPIPAGASAYTTAYANPYTSPAFNPYLNPYMTAVPISPDLGLLYMLGAQNARGGLGSGRISGVRSAEEGTDRHQPYSVPPTMGRASRPLSTGAARMPYTLAHPTAGAERYFQRVPDRGASAANYYGRSVRRIPQP